MALEQGHFNDYFNYKLKIYFTFSVKEVEFVFHLSQIILGTHSNLKAKKDKLCKKKGLEFIFLSYIVRSIHRFKKKA